MYIPRIFCPVSETLKEKKRAAVLGPRRTGKTQYVKTSLSLTASTTCL